MKFLFIVQGEGRGHLTQALTLEEHLLREGHNVAEVLVGKSRNRELPDFFLKKIKAPVKRFESPNFLPTPANCRNNLTRSVFYNLMHAPAYFRSIAFIRHRIQTTEADVVVNFYEMLTGLAYSFCRPKARQICIGHQYLFLHKDFQFPHVNRLQLAMLRIFTRITAIGSERKLALSFRKMEDDRKRHIHVVPPLLRKEVLRQTTSNGSYIHGYMVNSGFSAQVQAWHQARPEIPLHFFWDRKGEKEVRYVDATLSFHPLDDHAFLEQMGGCRAYASTAGFESICEAMYMGKPVLMVPAHIEQECNAYDAMRTGAGIISDEFCLDRLLDFSRTFTPDRNFIFWVHRTELLIDQLVYTPETEGNRLLTGIRMAQLFKRYKLVFYK